jgi:tetratricopeptide (TPR) repeat protein
VPAPPVPERLGPYRLLHELGRGGQAVVWLAEDSRIHRRVALKVLPALGPGSEAVLRRFRREAEVTSKLEHPAICPVYEADLEGGVPFIAMRYIEGETLARRLAGPRTDGGCVALHAPAPIVGCAADAWRALAAFFARCAHALHAAHEAGVLHRDVKPANIMVTPQGEPVLLDFGLARHDDQDSHTLSLSAEHSGTPTYMSPEQMTGRLRADRRSDVYSLGCALFECATGRPPFTAPTLEGLFHAVLHEDAPDARSLQRAVPADLAVIIATATEKDRERRYRTALDFALDLERFGRMEPIAARKVTRLQRAVRWGRRNPALAASLGVVFLLVLGSAVLLSYGVGAAGRADLEAKLRQQADAQRAQAENEQARMRQASADREFAGRLDELSMRLGTLMFGIARGPEAVAPLVPAYDAVLRQAGLDLGDADAVAKGKALVQRLRASDPDAERALLEGLRNLGALKGYAPERRQHLLQIVAEFADPGLAPFVAARSKWQQESVDEFAPLLRETALAPLTADQLADAGGMLVDIPGREADGLALIDRALLAKPDSFALHYQRAGMSMGRAAVGGTPATSLPAAQTAVEHFRAAVALRPRSGLARAALAGSLALRAFLAGDYAGFAPAWAIMATATEVEPNNALVWFLRADFLRRTPQREDDAKAACRRALALEPGLVPAQNLLRELEK